jgi:hypothetical protein
MTVSNVYLPVDQIDIATTFLRRRRFSSKSIIFQPMKFIPIDLDMNGGYIMMQENEDGFPRVKILWLLDGTTQLLPVRRRADGGKVIDEVKLPPKNWLKLQTEKYEKEAKYFRNLAHQYACLQIAEMN